MPSLLIADDHPLFRAALRQAAIACVADCQVSEAADLADALAALTAAPDTDLVLLDLHMPGSQGLSGLAALRGQHPGVAVLVVSAHDEPRTVRRVLDHGAAGFIPKSATPAQIGEGLLNKQIADRLAIQERTVKAHVTAIFEKLGVRNRTQAGLLLRSLDLGEPARVL